MTWLEGNSRDTRLAGERLQELIDRPQILGVPGTHNGLAGMLAKQAGFEALYISGGAVTASLGLPDLGILTLEELCFITRMVSRSTDLPLIVDGDTGYGEILNAMRVVQELERAGAGAVHIEDQVLPKKCGHLNDKRLISPEDAAAEFGRTPFFTADEFQDMGYDIVIWPATSMRIAAHAMAELYGHIKENGGCEALVDKMTSRADLYDTIGYYDYEALDESIAKTIVPAAPGE